MTADELSVLVVDDESNIRTTLSACLRSVGCRVTAVGTSAEALERARAEAVDVAFVDLRLDNESGLDLVPLLLRERPRAVIVVVTAFATVDTAVEAMRRGAADYLPKPFTPAQIRHAVARVRTDLSRRLRVDELEERLSAAVPDVDFASRSEAMLAALDVVRRAAPSDAPVLLRGESGSGKGVLAQALHAASGRAARRLVTVSCPLLTADLLAGELFGHVRGAFTGATADRAGRIEEAQGGTLFLDEVSEIEPGLQAKLLRFVQDREYERVGESRTRTADVRLVAATHRDLEQAVRDGRFRDDLYYRLAVIEVTVPPLRERIEDVEALAEGFAAFFSRGVGRSAPALTEDLRAALRRHTWPGNVRELRNTIERAVILRPGDTLDASCLPQRITGAPEAYGGVRVGGDCTLQEVDDEHVRRVLARTGTLDEAARVLGIDPSTLWRRRKRLAT